MNIKTSRSHIEDYEKCPRKRYWRYEHDGTGLEVSDERGLKLDARIGTGVHDGIEFGLSQGYDLTSTSAAVAASYGTTALYSKLREDGIEAEDQPEQQQADIKEAGELVGALTYAWLRLRLPTLLREGDILAIEKEMDVTFPVGQDSVTLMTRPDIVWRRRSDGAVLIRNLKTVRVPRTIWREQWALDQQTLTEPLAVDAWLDGMGVGPDGQACAGVIIDGLVTGEVKEYPLGSGKWYHNSPLIWAWVRNGDAPFGQDEWYPRYEWSCEQPHKMGNGRKCPGNKAHRLSGAHKKRVSEGYPGGILAWIDHLLEEDLHIVEEQIIELPPIIRAPYSIERWKRQVLHRELDIKFYGNIRSDDPEFDHHLDTHFPMHTASGNCLRPGKCMAYDLCFGTAATDPYAANYRPRRPHHKQEGEE